MNYYDAIIVGGGHNGLVAGGYLARNGLSVIVLEQRDLPGGPCAEIEYFPGYKGAITNSPGSLEPVVVRDLELESHGLRFVKPDPTLVYPFDDGSMFVGWRDRERSLSGIREFSEKDADQYYPFFDYLQDFADSLRISMFDAPPPFAEVVSGIDTPEKEAQLAKILFGSIKDLLDEWFVSEKTKALIASLAIVSNMVGPRTPGTVLRPLLRPLSLSAGNMTVDDDPRKQPLRGSTGLPIGGMGAVPKAMESSLRSFGGEVRTESRVAAIAKQPDGKMVVALESGEEFTSRVVLSNVNPRTTFFSLLQDQILDPFFVRELEQFKMRGSAFKVGLALDGLPKFQTEQIYGADEALLACQFRIAPSMDYMERAYDDAKYGRSSQEPMLWGLVPSVADPGLAPPGKHVMSVNVFHAPYHLAEGDWDTHKDEFGKRCVDALRQYMPDLDDHIDDVRFWSPLDLEREYGLVEGHIAHGELLPRNMFSFRPVPGWSGYSTPVEGLYLCGAGSWPGGFVSGLPGRNASMKVLADIASGKV